MKNYSIALLFLFFGPTMFGQSKIDKAIKKWNRETVPYIRVGELKNKDSVLLLDARKREEYLVSHFKDAIWVGHKEFEIDSVTQKIGDKNQEIVVYCSIGVRSEDIGEKLQKAGYNNVKNLYGGIFEWKNMGYPVYGPDGYETEKIHVFNKQWGKLLKEGEKVHKTPTVVRN